VIVGCERVTSISQLCLIETVCPTWTLFDFLFSGISSYYRVNFWEFYGQNHLQNVEIEEMLLGCEIISICLASAGTRAEKQEEMQV